MTRKDELMKLVNDSNAATVTPLVEKMLFLESQLESLEKLPMIKVHPTNPEIQKTTPAAKLYKEFLQQYTNIIKVISHAVGEDSTEEESPLRKWTRSRMESESIAD